MRFKNSVTLDSGLLVPATSLIASRTEQVAGNVVEANYLLAADANPAYRRYGNGKQEWGNGGGTAVDTNLYRDGTVTLATDQNFRAYGTISVFVASEASPRVRMHKDAGGTDKGGLLMCGVGTLVDTNLYRDAADKLKTDDSLEVVGTLKVKGAESGSRAFTMAMAA